MRPTGYLFALVAAATLLVQCKDDPASPAPAPTSLDSACMHAVPRTGLPTAFTPNGDGINDMYYPVSYSAAATGYHLLVSDLSGQHLFETDSPTDKWDGRNKNDGLIVPGLKRADITYTNADNQLVSVCSFVYLLKSDACVHVQGIDISLLVFPDQFDTNGDPVYVTSETLCP